MFQFTLFVLSLLGNVMFISYRASLTSTLAFTRSVKPFTDWDSFMRTDFSLIVDKFSKVDYLDMAANPAAKRVFDHRTDPENLFYNIVSIKGLKPACYIHQFSVYRHEPHPDGK